MTARRDTPRLRYVRSVITRARFDNLHQNRIRCSRSPPLLILLRHRVRSLTNSTQPTDISPSRSFTHTPIVSRPGRQCLLPHRPPTHAPNMQQNTAVTKSPFHPAPTQFSYASAHSLSTLVWRPATPCRPCLEEHPLLCEAFSAYNLHLWNQYASMQLRVRAHKDHKCTTVLPFKRCVVVDIFNMCYVSASST